MVLKTLVDELPYPGVNVAGRPTVPELVVTDEIKVDDLVVVLAGAPIWTLKMIAYMVSFCLRTLPDAELSVPNITVMKMSSPAALLGTIPDSVSLAVSRAIQGLFGTSLIDMSTSVGFLL